MYNYYYGTGKDSPRRKAASKNGKYKRAKYWLSKYIIIIINYIEIAIDLVLANQQLLVSLEFRLNFHHNLPFLPRLELDVLDLFLVPELDLFLTASTPSSPAEAADLSFSHRTVSSASACLWVLLFSDYFSLTPLAIDLLRHFFIFVQSSFGILSPVFSLLMNFHNPFDYQFSRNKGILLSKFVKRCQVDFKELKVVLF